MRKLPRPHGPPHRTSAIRFRILQLLRRLPPMCGMSAIGYAGLINPYTIAVRTRAAARVHLLCLTHHAP